MKAPRGMGWLTNPKKAAYNRVYNRTTFDVFEKPSRSQRRSVTRLPSRQISSASVIVFGVIVVVALARFFG